MTKNKLYCYVDETGQDTKGDFFLISIVLTGIVKKDGLEEILEDLENKTSKNKTKWTRTPFTIRTNFIEELSKIKELRKSIYYSVYKDTKTYTQLTSFSIAKAVFAKEENNYSVTVIIDGLTKKDTAKIRVELKKLKVKYDNIRGMKDEQSVFLRLADCIAGFIRDYTENQTYTKELFKLLQDKEMIIEV